MQSSQVRNVGFQSNARGAGSSGLAKRDVPAWMQDQRIFPLDWFSCSRSNIVRCTREYVSELSKWRNSSSINWLSKLKHVVKRIMMFLHTHTAYVDEKSLLECDVEDDLITLVSLYMDMELQVLELKRDGAAAAPEAAARTVRLYTDRITHWLYTMLTAHEHRVDALLATTVHTPRTRPVLDPIFRRVLSETEPSPMNNISYVRHMLAYKVWRERVVSAEDADAAVLRSRLEPRLVPADYAAFPAALLRCVPTAPRHADGLTVARAHARPHNISLPDACRRFARCCRELPAAAATAAVDVCVDFDGISLVDEELFDDETSEINNIMEMISERKTKRRTRLPPAMSKIVIDLTEPAPSPSVSNQTPIDIIDLTEEDEKPVVTSVYRSVEPVAVQSTPKSPPTPMAPPITATVHMTRKQPMDSCPVAAKAPPVETRCFRAYRDKDDVYMSPNLVDFIFTYSLRRRYDDDVPIGKDTKSTCFEFTNEDDVETEDETLAKEQESRKFESMLTNTDNASSDQEVAEFCDTLFSKKLTVCDKFRQQNDSIVPHLDNQLNRTRSRTRKNSKSAKELSELSRPLSVAEDHECPKQLSNVELTNSRLQDSIREPVSTIASIYDMAQANPILLKTQPEKSTRVFGTYSRHLTEKLDKRKVESPPLVKEPLDIPAINKLSDTQFEYERISSPECISETDDAIFSSDKKSEIPDELKPRLTEQLNEKESPPCRSHSADKSDEIQTDLTQKLCDPTTKTPTIESRTEDNQAQLFDASDQTPDADELRSESSVDTRPHLIDESTVNLLEDKLTQDNMKSTVTPEVEPVPVIESVQPELLDITIPTVLNSTDNVIENKLDVTEDTKTVTEVQIESTIEPEVTVNDLFHTNCEPQLNEEPVSTHEEICAENAEPLVEEECLTVEESVQVIPEVALSVPETTACPNDLSLTETEVLVTNNLKEEELVTDSSVKNASVIESCDLETVLEEVTETIDLHNVLESVTETIVQQPSDDIINEILVEQQEETTVNPENQEEPALALEVDNLIHSEQPESVVVDHKPTIDQSTTPEMPTPCLETNETAGEVVTEIVSEAALESQDDLFVNTTIDKVNEPQSNNESQIDLIVDETIHEINVSNESNDETHPLTEEPTIEVVEETCNNQIETIVDENMHVFDLPNQETCEKVEQLEITEETIEKPTEDCVDDLIENSTEIVHDLATPVTEQQSELFTSEPQNEMNSTHATCETVQYEEPKTLEDLTNVTQPLIDDTIDQTPVEIDHTNILNRATCQNVEEAEVEVVEEVVCESIPVEREQEIVQHDVLTQETCQQIYQPVTGDSNESENRENNVVVETTDETVVGVDIQETCPVIEQTFVEASDTCQQVEENTIISSCQTETSIDEPVQKIDMHSEKSQSTEANLFEVSAVETKQQTEDDTISSSNKACSSTELEVVPDVSSPVEEEVLETVTESTELKTTNVESVAESLTEEEPAKESTLPDESTSAELVVETSTLITSPVDLKTLSNDTLPVEVELETIPEESRTVEQVQISTAAETTIEDTKVKIDKRRRRRKSPLLKIRKDMQVNEETVTDDKKSATKKKDITPTEHNTTDEITTKIEDIQVPTSNKRSRKRKTEQITDTQPDSTVKTSSTDENNCDVLGASTLKRRRRKVDSVVDVADKFADKPIVEEANKDTFTQTRRKKVPMVKTEEQKPTEDQPEHVPTSELPAEEIELEYVSEQPLKKSSSKENLLDNPVPELKKTKSRRKQNLKDIAIEEAASKKAVVLCEKLSSKDIVNLSQSSKSDVINEVVDSQASIVLDVEEKSPKKKSKSKKISQVIESDVVANKQTIVEEKECLKTTEENVDKKVRRPRGRPPKNKLKLQTEDLTSQLSETKSTVATSPTEECPTPNLQENATTTPDLPLPETDPSATQNPLDKMTEDDLPLTVRKVNLINKSFEFSDDELPLTFRKEISKNKEAEVVTSSVVAERKYEPKLEENIKLGKSKKTKSIKKTTKQDSERNLKNLEVKSTEMDEAIKTDKQNSTTFADPLQTEELCDEKPDKSSRRYNARTSSQNSETKQKSSKLSKEAFAKLGLDLIEVESVRESKSKVSSPESLSRESEKLQLPFIGKKTYSRKAKKLLKIHSNKSFLCREDKSPKLVVVVSENQMDVLKSCDIKNDSAADQTDLQLAQSKTEEKSVACDKKDKKKQTQDNFESVDKQIEEDKITNLQNDVNKNKILNNKLRGKKTKASLELSTAPAVDPDRKDLDNITNEESNSFKTETKSILYREENTNNVVFVKLKSKSPASKFVKNRKVKTASPKSKPKKSLTPISKSKTINKVKAKTVKMKKLKSERFGKRPRKSKLSPKTLTKFSNNNSTIASDLKSRELFPSSSSVNSEDKIEDKIVPVTVEEHENKEVQITIPEIPVEKVADEIRHFQLDSETTTIFPRINGNIPTTEDNKIITELSENASLNSVNVENELATVSHPVADTNFEHNSNDENSNCDLIIDTSDKSSESEENDTENSNKEFKSTNFSEAFAKTSESVVTPTKIDYTIDAILDKTDAEKAVNTTVHTIDSILGNEALESCVPAEVNESVITDFIASSGAQNDLSIETILTEGAVDETTASGNKVVEHHAEIIEVMEGILETLDITPCVAVEKCQKCSVNGVQKVNKKYKVYNAYEKRINCPSVAEKPKRSKGTKAAANIILPSRTSKDVIDTTDQQVKVQNLHEKLNNIKDSVGKKTKRSKNSKVVEEIVEISHKSKDAEKPKRSAVPKVVQDIVESFETSNDTPVDKIAEDIQTKKPEKSKRSKVSKVVEEIVEAFRASKDTPVENTDNLEMLASTALKHIPLNTVTENNNIVDMTISLENANPIAFDQPLQKNEICSLVLFPESVPESSAPIVDVPVPMDNDATYKVQKLSESKSKGSLLQNKIQSLIELASKKNAPEKLPNNKENVNDLLTSLEHTLNKTSDTVQPCPAFVAELVQPEQPIPVTLPLPAPIIDNDSMYKVQNLPEDKLKGSVLQNQTQTLTELACKKNEPGKLANSDENVNDLLTSLECMLYKPNDTVQPCPAFVPEFVPPEQPIPMTIPNTAHVNLTADDDDFIKTEPPKKLNGFSCLIDQPLEVKTTVETPVKPVPNIDNDIFSEIASLIVDKPFETKSKNKKDHKEPKVAPKPNSKQAKLNSDASYMLSKYKRISGSVKQAETSCQQSTSSSIKSSSPPNYIRTTRPVRMVTTKKRKSSVTDSAEAPPTKKSTDEVFNQVLEEYKRELAKNSPLKTDLSEKINAAQPPVMSDMMPDLDAEEKLAPAPTENMISLSDLQLPIPAPEPLSKSLNFIQAPEVIESLPLPTIKPESEPIVKIPQEQVGEEISFPISAAKDILPAELSTKPIEADIPIVIPLEEIATDVTTPVEPELMNEKIIDPVIPIVEPQTTPVEPEIPNAQTLPIIESQILEEPKSTMSSEVIALPAENTIPIEATNKLDEDQTSVEEIFVASEVLPNPEQVILNPERVGIVPDPQSVEVVPEPVETVPSPLGFSAEAVPDLEPVEVASSLEQVGIVPDSELNEVIPNSEFAEIVPDPQSVEVLSPEIVEDVPEPAEIIPSPLDLTTEAVPDPEPMEVVPYLEPTKFVSPVDEKYLDNRSATALEVVHEWFNRSDNKVEPEPYAEISTYQTIDECCFEEISNCSEISHGATGGSSVRKSEEKVFKTPDSGIAFDEDSVQKDKLVDSQNLTDTEMYYPSHSSTTDKYYSDAEDAHHELENSKYKIAHPSLQSSKNQSLKVSIGLDRIKSILPLLIKPHPNNDPRGLAIKARKRQLKEIERINKRRHSTIEEVSVQPTTSTKSYEETRESAKEKSKSKRKKYSESEDVPPELGVEVVVSPAPSQTESSNIRTKGSKKEYPDCLFGITESPVPSGSFNSPYTSDISLPEEPTFYVECIVDLCKDFQNQYYESFDSLKEQESLQANYNVDDPPKDEPHSLQAGYCVVDSQFPLSEHMNDTDLLSIMIDNGMMMSDKRMMAVNMHQIQPEVKPHNAEQKREFDDDTDLSITKISGIVEGICKKLDSDTVKYCHVDPNLLSKTNSSDVKVNQPMAEPVAVACELPQAVKNTSEIQHTETIQPLYTTGPVKTIRTASIPEVPHLQVSDATADTKVIVERVDCTPTRPVVSSVQLQVRTPNSSTSKMESHSPSVDHATKPIINETSTEFSSDIRVQKPATSFSYIRAKTKERKVDNSATKHRKDSTYSGDLFAFPAGGEHVDKSRNYPSNVVSNGKSPRVPDRRTSTDYKRQKTPDTKSNHSQNTPVRQPNYTKPNTSEVHHQKRHDLKTSQMVYNPKPINQRPAEHRVNDSKVIYHKEQSSTAWRTHYYGADNPHQSHSDHVVAKKTPEPTKKSSKESSKDWLNDPYIKRMVAKANSYYDKRK